MKKSETWGTQWFCSVDPHELETFEEFAYYLEALLTGPCAVWEEGGELTLRHIKARVDTVGGLKIEIYPDEHTPPHFHVRSATVDASFRIEDCSCLAGQISRSDFDKIRYWHQNAKPLLVEKWNLLRPTDCVVGPYRGS
jgi:hypothetical protein